MNIFTRLLRRLRSMFIDNKDVGKIFGVSLISSDEMNSALKRWGYISEGKPYWLDGEDGIETINMAKHVCDTRARLTTLDIGISVSGDNARTKYLQEQADKLIAKLPERIADGDRLGGLVIKWNGTSWDFVLPSQFGITAVTDGVITGAIFATNASQGRDHYTRLEYHRFEGDEYIVTNKAFFNTVNGDNSHLGSEVKLTEVEAWKDIQPETKISGLEKPLFAFYRVSGSNTVDPDSPLGMSVFANAIVELKAIDIAVSRKNTEIEDSKHITFVGQALVQNAKNNGVNLPRYVRGLGMGLNDTETSAVHEHVATLLTDQRIRDLNFDLSLLGVKCGFSEGMFVLDGQTGVITATQVEANDRDTIQTIKDDRDALKNAIETALYGVNAFATLYGDAPEGDYELNFNFGDITYNYEEDRAMWLTYVTNGWVPKWKYLVKFEGFSEEEAKQLIADAQAEQMQSAMLFSGMQGGEGV